MINHSGGCPGADMTWENEGKQYGVETIAYSFPGHKQDSPTPKILNQSELDEGYEHVLIADKTLHRNVESIFYPYVKNLLCRNWFQVKNSTDVFAIGSFIHNPIVNGGTGWAVQMAIDNNKTIYFFDQPSNHWYKYNNSDKMFILLETTPILSENFAGIGTREIKENGIRAIQNVYKCTFSKT